MLAAVLALAGVPFWESKPPAQWTDQEIQELLARSPWVQHAVPARGFDGVPVYLASARPIEEAELELLRRRPQPASEDPEGDEYREFMKQNRGKYIVLAVAYTNARALDHPDERERFQNGCVLKIGRRKYKMTGHFPPTASDPVLRLVFPRVLPPSGRIQFELYLPLASEPYRGVEFRLNELSYRGAPEL